ncbi:Uncharacterized protein BM_BM17097 [Brugia malayi]|uniref:YEATS family protein n=1 Tax=Brugia malayi TaxID=6279 RepID=A0A4E9FVE8_BRUMA|nr:Uncharacterized protein BM_BM17097 [Brugia malayi]VIO99785.1 Uncharacterized protein BM_BM17097 [Brugia malayi]
MERVKDKIFIRPIVYGNTAHYLGKKREEDGHTHEWTVFVKPYYNEDPSKYIRKVQFKLHDSYANATRMVEKPPYEVTETGWGEFEIQIRIYFVDVNEKPMRKMSIVQEKKFEEVEYRLDRLREKSERLIKACYDEDEEVDDLKSQISE